MQKLTSQQIQYICDYIDAFDIKYYELREELLDHMINSTETKMTEESIPFVDAVLHAGNEFGRDGFKSIMKEREQHLAQYYRKQYQYILRSYFRFPQILGSVLFAVTVFTMSSMFEKPFKITLIVIFSTMLLSLLQILQSLQYKKVQGQPLLLMSVFYNTFSLAVIIPNFCLSFILIKDTVNLSNPLLIALLTILSTVSFMSFLSYRKLRERVIKNVKQLYFA